MRVENQQISQIFTVRYKRVHDYFVLPKFVGYIYFSYLIRRKHLTKNSYNIVQYLTVPREYERIIILLHDKMDLFHSIDQIFLQLSAYKFFGRLLII